MRKIFLTLCSLLLLFPLIQTSYVQANSETFQAITSDDDWKIKKINRIMTIKNQSKSLEMKKANQKHQTQNEITTTSVQYRGQASNFKQDEYVFKVAQQSKIQIQANHTSNKIDYLLIGIDPYGNLSFYQDGDTLPIGEYSFIVFVDNNTLLNYDYTIQGVHFAEEPETKLPSISFTSPNLPIHRLPKNTSQLLFEGTTDTAFTLISNESYTRTFQGNFHFTIPLKTGNNYVDMYSFTSSGNATYINLDFIVPALKRLGGYDRFEVAANVSKEMPPSDTIIISSGGNGKFADALSGGALAGLYQAPILLTGQTSLPNATIEEIQRRQPNRAIIMGGTGTVDPAVEDQLRTLGINIIQRIDGANRFAVSANAAKELTRVLGSQTKDTAIIASGLDFPDALSASSLTSDALIPTLLINPNSSSLPSEIDAFLKSHPNIKHFVIVGGVGSVPNTIASKLTSYGSVQRIDGKDRYAVNLNLIKQFGMDMRYLVFAKGTDYPDALAGGPLAGSLAPTLSPLILTPTNSLYADFKTYLDSKKRDIQVIYLLGDESSISSQVEAQLNTYID